MKSITKKKSSEDFKTLDELAEEQGIPPVQDLDKIFALWPEEADPDELLEFILTDRAERRRLIKESE
ncbi:hypothetical protein ISS30_10220 [bacterium]|nr:hypothetical protein [bacterium]